MAKRVESVLRESGYSVIICNTDENPETERFYLNKLVSMRVDGCGYLMSLETPPTAIIAGNNDMAPGIYKYLYQHQIRVPEDISVVSYGNIENSELFRIQPTYATLNPYFLGQKAVAHLLSRIERRDLGKREVIFEAQLIVRDSTRAIL